MADTPSDTYDHVPTTCNLRPFLRGDADEYGDGVAELLTHAQHVLDATEFQMTEEEFAVRWAHLEEAQDAWNLDDDIDGVRDCLRSAFFDWPSPILQAA